MTQATGTAALAAGGSGTPLARLANTNSFFYATDLNEAYQLPSFLEGRPAASPGNDALARMAVNLRASRKQAA
jgi:hypothetical protein